MHRSLLFALPLILGLAAPASAIIDAAEGSQYLYLTTGPEDLHGGGDTGLDLNGNGANESDLSSVQVDFVGAGTLGFYWDVLTEEISGGVPDWFSILLDGSEILAGSIAVDGIVPNPAPALDGFTDGAIGGPDGSFFGDGRLGWAMFTVAVGAGAHELVFNVYDEDDDVVDTALLIDAISLDGLVFQGFEGGTPGSPPMLGALVGNVTVEDGESFSQEDVPEPSAAALILFGLIGAARVSRRP